MKFVTRDYVVDPTTHAKLGFQGSNGIVPIVVKYTPKVSTFSFYQEMCALPEMCALVGAAR